MRRKTNILVLILILSVVLFSLTACNKETEKSEFNLPVGSYPSLSNTISSFDQQIINKALLETASEDELKDAVMTMYKIANNSRINTELSLMVQNSQMIPKLNLGTVVMHGFTLKNGDAWFYQFAAQGVSEDETAALLFNAFGSQQLQIAYTTGDGTYYYSKEQSAKPECDCSLEVFPYATFKVVKELTKYDTEDAFQNDRFYLNSQLEINNMDLVRDILMDGSKITYDATNHLYTVEFAVDCENADSDLLEKWYECANKDLGSSGEIESYSYWNAKMELWDNGYIKSFVSYEKKNAGMAGGEVTNAFEYIYEESEIKNLLAQDTRFTNASTLSIDEFLEGYVQIANQQVPASMGKLTKIIVIVVPVIVVVIVLFVVIFEVLVKKGKLPKVAERRAIKKEKRLAKKNR